MSRRRKGDATGGTSVRVVCRVRPENQMEKANSGRTVTEVSADCIGLRLRTLDGDEHDFNFDYVFGSDSRQDYVYNHAAAPTIYDVQRGYNGTIFAYGQTGAGKTFTMEGGGSPESEGIIPRAAREIFRYATEAEAHLEFEVECSHMEIYKEKIRDLLDTTKTNLPIRDDPARGVYVQGMTKAYVTSAEELLAVMKQGSMNRAMSSTAMNETSSRSHSIFQITLQQRNTQDGTVSTGKLSLVDLAGSEMVKKTMAKGERLEEAKTINKSLSALGNVINALTDGKSTHVPYRNSKLTRVLQESLGGNARTTLVIAVSPSSFNEIETLSTLRFGKRAKQIKNQAKVNKERSPEEMKPV